MRSEDADHFKRLALQACEEAILSFGLDAFGDEVYPEVRATLRDSADDRLPWTMPVYSAYEREVELHDVRLKVSKEIQPGVPGTKVIDR